MPADLSPTGRLAQLRESRAPLGRSRAEPGLEQQRSSTFAPRHTGGGGGESVGSDSCCSSPPGSSCYSSQRSSPAPAPTQAAMPSPQPAHPPGSAQPHHQYHHHHQHQHPPHSASSSSLSFLLLEEEEEDEPETNVDTGCAVMPSSRVERPAVVGASALETLARELSRCLPNPHAPTLDVARTWAPGSPAGTESQEARTTEQQTVGVEPGPPQGQNQTQPADEFFI